jgi:hypothetical protein
MFKRILGLIVVGIVSWPAIAGSQVPATLSMEGVVAVRGERFTGQGAFRFALVNKNTDSFLWKNDGTATGDPSPPVSPVILLVVNGVYQVRLGDASIGESMTALPPTVFQSNQNVAVRVWFDDQQGGGVHQLTPDVTITTSPYSQYAAAATQLNIPGTNVAVVTVDPSGKVGIGTPNPAHQLVVNGTMQSAGLVMSGPVSGIGFDGWDRDESNDLTTATEFAGSVSGTFDSVSINDDSHNHGDGTLTDALSINNGRLFAPAGPGSVGIGTDTPEAALDVRGDVVATGAYAGFGIMPIGSIVAWHKNIGPVALTLSDGWVECNGDPIPDGSPLLETGATDTPNLNSDIVGGSGRFLRGASESGTVQEDYTRQPRTIGFFTSTNATVHNHQMMGAGRTGNSPGPGNFLQGANNTQPYGNKVTAGATILHSHSLNGGDVETRPYNMSVIWIMRVK